MHQSPAHVMAFDLEVAPQSISNTTAAGTGVDMQGWDGVLFLFSVGAMSQEGTITAKAQTDTASNFGSPADVTSAAMTTIGGSANASKNVGIDVWNPAERYVRLFATATGAGTVPIGATSVRYRGSGRFPITQTLDELVTV